MILVQRADIAYLNIYVNLESVPKQYGGLYATISIYSISYHII